MKWLVYGAGVLGAYLLYTTAKAPLQTAVTGLVPPAE